MKLSKKETPKEDIVSLREQLQNTEHRISALEGQKRVLKDKILSLEIAPVKIGDYVIATVPSGRTSKEQKCLLESDNGILYLRPVTKSGELSGRRFSFTPVTQSYQDYLKPVEE